MEFLTGGSDSDKEFCEERWPWRCVSVFLGGSVPSDSFGRKGHQQEAPAVWVPLFGHDMMYPFVLLGLGEGQRDLLNNVI